MAEIHCRTCLEVIRKPKIYVSLEGNTTKSKEIKSKLEACVPEMTINTVTSPVICGQCLILLNASYEFRRKCIAVEEKIYSYLFDAEGDVVDLQFIANPCPGSKSYSAGIKQEAQSDIVCEVEIDCEIIENDNEDFLLSSIKDERDCDFEATDTMFSYDNSVQFSTNENLTHVPEDDKKSTEGNESETNPLPNCSVLITALPDNLSDANVELNQDVNCQEDLTKKSRKRKKKRGGRKKVDLQDNDICYVCYPYNSTTAEPMKIKERAKLQEDEKPYKCGVCGFNSSIKLNVHMRIHTGEKPHKCNVCGFASAYPYHLLCHMKTHTKKMSHDCAYCIFSTDSELDLKNHMDDHPGCKMYKCNKCEYSTDVLRYLKYHKLIHSSKQIYECASCQFKTKYKNILITHVGSHLQKKSFKCTKCKFFTDQKRAFNYHLKTHAN